MSTKFLVTIDDLTLFADEQGWLQIAEYCWMTPLGNIVKANIGEYGSISEIRLLTTLS